MAVGQGYPVPGGGRGQMRAADADRDRAVNYLTTAYTEGRLAKDEYDARLETALSARTYADLDQVVTDLPGARAGPVPRRGPSPTKGMALAGMLLGWAAVAMGVLAILALTLFVVTSSGHTAGIAVHPHLLPNVHTLPEINPPPRLAP